MHEKQRERSSDEANPASARESLDDIQGAVFTETQDQDVFPGVSGYYFPESDKTKPLADRPASVVMAAT